MTKKKKILIACLSVAACIIVAVSVTLGLYFGLKDRRDVKMPPILMTDYYSSTVRSNSVGDLPLQTFISSKPTTSSKAFSRHRTLTFSGELNMLGGMYLECVYFYFYCNTTKADLVVTVSVTGLTAGNSDSTGLPEGSHQMKQDLSINAIAGKGMLMRMDIDKTVLGAASGSDTSLIISLENEPALINADFAWTVYGVQVYGEHRA